MKKLLFVISFILIAGGATLFAQTNAKLGYINSTELMQMMPGMDTVETALNAHRISLEQTMQTMVQEYQSKAGDYQNNYNTMSQIIRQTKEKEIQDMQARIQQFQQTADQDLQRKRAELFNPLIERAQLAISNVAKENGYTYVFDVSAGALVYFENGDDITALVKTKLGIK
jgi:outer membrane protein